MCAVFPAWGQYVWEPALQHASVYTPGSFYKSAISLTLGKHSSALPKADGPIDLNYWPAQGSHSRLRPLSLMKWKWLWPLLSTLCRYLLTTHRRFRSTFLEVYISTYYSNTFSYHLATLSLHSGFFFSPSLLFFLKMQILSHQQFPQMWCYTYSNQLHRTKPLHHVCCVWSLSACLYLSVA